VRPNGSRKLRLLIVEDSAPDVNRTQIRFGGIACKSSSGPWKGLDQSVQN
jgi:hypothetical protein